MNVVILTGRLTQDPDVRYTDGQEPMCISHFSLAVDRNRTDQNGERLTDFIRCVCFGRRAEWMGKYTNKGLKLEVRGRWQTGSYTNRDGQKVYTNECYCEEVNFGESKAAAQRGNMQGTSQVNYQNTPHYQNQQPTQRPPQNQQYSQQSLFQNSQNNATLPDGFMNIPDNVDDEGLPFN